jgi:hypothetical protein
VVRAAHREAERIVEEARAEGRTLRLEAEDYVDGKLAGFEALLGRTMAAVQRGRERLRATAEGHGAVGELALDDGDAGTQFFDHERGA